MAARGILLVLLLLKHLTDWSIIGSERIKVLDRISKILGILRSPNAFSFYTLFAMWAVLTLFYYFGELVEFAHWEALRWQFLYSVHDVHRLLFLAPIMYAAYVFGVKATIIITVISLMTFLPRALFISTFPDPLARMLAFILIGGIMGYLTAIVRRESKRRTHLETLLTGERDKLLGILERMQEGVLIVGPDYRIRYMNAAARRDFGEVVGSPCYESLQVFDEPCRQSCKLPSVLAGKIERWEYGLPDGRTYEVLASPYRDTDGVVCQLTIFTNTTQCKNAKANSQDSTG